MKTKTLLMIPLALLITSASLSAQPLEQLRARVAVAKDIKQIGKQIGLSDEQRAEIKKVLQARKVDITRQLKQSKAAREAMQAAVMEHGAQSPEARQAATAIGDIAESRALLTAEILTEVSYINSRF